MQPQQSQTRGVANQAREKRQGGGGGTIGTQKNAPKKILLRISRCYILILKYTNLARRRFLHGDILDYKGRIDQHGLQPLFD